MVSQFNNNIGIKSFCDSRVVKSQFQVRFVSKHIVYISISIYSQLWKAKKGMWVHSSPKLSVMSQFERGWGVICAVGKRL